MATQRRTTRTMARAVVAACVMAFVGAVAPHALASIRAAVEVPGERVTSFDAAITIGPDGTAGVVEHITYDFGAQSRHGIVRALPDRFRCEAVGVTARCPRGYDRLTPLSQVSASSPSGAPASVARSRKSGSLVLRIGDPHRTVTGVQRYDIGYTIRGVFNPAATAAGDRLAELLWNVNGNAWPVPTEALTARVTGPAAIVTAACVRGGVGATTPCDSVSVDGSTVDVHAATLTPGQNVTVLVRLPEDAIDTAPILSRHWTPERAFSISPATIGAAALATLLGASAVVARARRARDRRYAGADVEVAMGRPGQPETYLRPFEKVPQVIEFAPPNGIRPGQIGMLINQRADPTDVSATIVDLARRGHLTIAEVPGAGGRVGDHLLTRRENPRDAVAGYEQVLLDGLFASGNEVALSTLKRTWQSSFNKVKSAMYDDLVGNGWYERRPDRHVARALATAIAALVAAGVVAVLVVRFTTFGIAAIPLVLAAAGLVAIATRAPVRTAAGTAMLARSLGFRRLIRTPTQQDMARFAERHDLFLDYLPFAVVFGATAGWARTFAALGAPPPSTGWYVPLPGAAAPDLDAFGSSIGSFTTTAGTTLNAAASGSSSGSHGFSSGGGFGGGGGGSW